MKIKTKYVWLDGKKWKVNRGFAPTKFDHYLLISREDNLHLHDDCKTTPVQMRLIDTANDTFYWDTVENRKILKQLKPIQEATAQLTVAQFDY